LAENRFEQGMKTRRSVLGDPHVDRASANITELDDFFQQYITENVWGALWTNPALSRRDRSIIIREALMHVAIYAGIPAGNTAFRIAKQVFAELDNQKPDQGETQS
jgi:4-carboxymuconolactone decarboxylase